MSRPRTKLGVPVAAEPAGPAPGDEIGGRYRLIRLVGEGGMGEVWEAEQGALGRRVALKLVRAAESTTEGMRRFLREGHVVSGFSHPNVVPVHDVGWHRGRPYLVMPLLDGEDLGEKLARGRIFSLREVVELLRGPAAGLDAIHRAGIVHRDLKPENLFVSRGEDGSTVTRILDFGLATLLDPGRTRLTREGTILGTPQYISPEAARGKTPTPQSDLYSLAVVVFELLTLRLPFDADDPMQVLVAKLDREPPSLASRGYPTEDPRLEAILARALAREPDARHPRAVELLDALAELAVEGGPRAPAPATNGRRRVRSSVLTASSLAPPARSHSVEIPLTRRPASVALPLVRRRTEAQDGEPGEVESVAEAPSRPPARSEPPPALPVDRRLPWVLGLLALAVSALLCLWVALG